MSVYVSGELKVANINRAAYGEIFFSDICNDDLWFKARLAFITIDEKSERRNVPTLPISYRQRVLNVLAAILTR